MVDKFGIRLFVSGLSDPSAKVQVAALNMLNLALSQPDLTVRARAALSEVSDHFLRVDAAAFCERSGMPRP